MQKIKNPILCWIVILAVFIRPTPAHAFAPLAVVAVGGIIAATGVMVAGAGVYKPPTFAQANAAVDSVTGDITRKVVVARAFADGLSSGLRGFQSQYTLDFSKAKQWVKDHSASFPALSSPFASSDVPQGYSGVTNEWDGQSWVGEHLIDGSYGLKKIISYSTGSIQQVTKKGADFDSWVPTTYGAVSCGGRQWIKYLSTSITLYWWGGDWGSTGSYLYIKTWVVGAPTASAPTLFPNYQDTPSAFAAAYPNTQAGQDETDKIAADYPAAIKSEPQEMTPDQINEAMKQIQAEMSDATADAAEAAAAADPTNTALQIAAEQARLEANKDAVTAEAERAQAEVKPEEKTDTPPPSGPALDQDLQIDLSPFLGLKDKAMGKFPFSAVSSLGSIFSGLTADPVTPSMDMPMPWGLPPAKISLSKWDDFAVKWRFLIAMMFHASCIYAIVRRYS